MTLAKLAAAALLAGAAIGVTASTASAAIVCNAENVCWHVRDRYHYNYRPEFGVVVHENGWRWGPGEHYAFREHTGRGYWYHGGWRRF